MSKEHPIFVWFPTVHAENHLVHNKSDYEIPPEWVKDPNFKPRNKYDLKAIKVTDWAGKLIRKADACMKTIKDMGCVVATGHVSWQEAKRLAEECIARDIKVIVTHPMQRDIAMPPEVQVELAKNGAFIEYCYIMYLDRDHSQDYPLEEQVRCMKAIGFDRVSLTSDGGQKRNPGPTDSLKAYIKLLEQHGVQKKEFRKMLVENPKNILGR
jgi:predicted metal-dependent phosphotriesterase family hydrolase